LSSFGINFLKISTLSKIFKKKVQPLERTAKVAQVLRQKTNIENALRVIAFKKILLFLTILGNVITPHQY
jgi:hypothetical protein